MTPSERLVFDLCTRSFLSLWSYANPRRPDGRELCDVLLVFGERVVIFSVKEVAFNEEADPLIAAQRWIRKAVDASVAQLLGARRQLEKLTRVVRHDGTDGVELPRTDRRRVHLVAVAAGGERAVPFFAGEKEGSYVHVVDEIALREILGELDTTPDFLQYLEAKESFPGTLVVDGEEELLGLYLQSGRTLPANVHMLIAEEGVWQAIRRKPEFRARKKADVSSRWWDRMVERFIQDYEVRPDLGPKPSDHELVVRSMAAENRFARRILSDSCLGWLRTRQTGARYMVSPVSGVAYVFATYPRDWSREHRTTELTARCLVARSPAVTGRPTVVGLGTEVYEPSGYSMDAVYLHVPEWTEEEEQAANDARSRLGIMKEPTMRRMSVDEFPKPDSTRTERNRKKRERKARR